MNNKAVKVFLSVILVLVLVIGGIAVGNTIKKRQAGSEARRRTRFRHKG